MCLHPECLALCPLSRYEEAASLAPSQQRPQQSPNEEQSESSGSLINRPHAGIGGCCVLCTTSRAPLKLRPSMDMNNLTQRSQPGPALGPEGW